ncbi:UNVERIFIED_CONTAM: hypothetical protein Sradi_0147100 [Sesamum radiatum]|uniref:RNase H type-1 domain-containing protein n=1 Tax=Sesamum radiatum TaxID=300843 RepID=A0AAW2WNK5_SESRA
MQYQIGGAPEDERQGIPFSEAVMADEMSVNYRTPTITEYDGTTDMQEHLSRLKNIALLHRFNTTALEVPFCYSRGESHCLLTRTSRRGPLQALAMKPISKFDAILAPAAKYINIENAQATKKESCGEKRKETKEEVPSKRPRTEFWDRKYPFQRVNTIHTPLTVPITQALLAVKGKNLLTRPKSWKDGPHHPKSDKFCRFHNDYDHTTEEYWNIKNEIERLIQNGQLALSSSEIRKENKCRFITPVKDLIDRRPVAPIEKIALTLVITARRLRPYFFSHPVGVKTNIPLKQTLGKSDTFGRMVKCVMELSVYDISYLPQTITKAQALADFISNTARISLGDTPKAEKWLLNMDGSSTIQDSGAGIVVPFPHGEDLEFVAKFGFNASNNEAEYEALLIDMKVAYKAGARYLVAYSDSQLVVKQVESTYEAKEENMI